MRHDARMTSAPAADFLWTPLHDWPLDSILALQAQAYAPALREKGAVLQAKRDASSRMHPLSWAVASALAPTRLCAYAIACPWRNDMPAQWNHVHLPPAAPDCLYVHDIAVAADWQGHHLAAGLLQRILDEGDKLGYRQAVLIAVQGAERYWCRHGFVPDRAAGMSGFGDSAIRMTRVWTGK